MRNLIRGIAIGIVASLTVMLIRQQQAKVRQASTQTGIEAKIAEIRRDMAVRSEDSAQDAEDIHRSFNEINQTISHISTVINDRRRVN